MRLLGPGMCRLPKRKFRKSAKTGRARDNEFSDVEIKDVSRALLNAAWFTVPRGSPGALLELSTFVRRCTCSTLTASCPTARCPKKARVQ